MVKKKGPGTTPKSMLGPGSAQLGLVSAQLGSAWDRLWLRLTRLALAWLGFGLWCAQPGTPPNLVLSKETCTKHGIWGPARYPPKFVSGLDSAHQLKTKTIVCEGPLEILFFKKMPDIEPDRLLGRTSPDAAHLIGLFGICRVDVISRKKQSKYKQRSLYCCVYALYRKSSIFMKSNREVKEGRKKNTRWEIER